MRGELLIRKAVAGCLLALASVLLSRTVLLRNFLISEYASMLVLHKRVIFYSFKAPIPASAISLASFSLSNTATNSL